MPPSFTISDLRRRPEFFDTVADRIWRAWWKDGGHPLGTVSGRLRENLNAEPIPIALVAHDGATFLGTSSVIASDLEERPDYTPWVAAVWGQAAGPFERYRCRAGRTRRARLLCAGNYAVPYLCARPARSAFYESLGWIPIERDVGERGLTVFIKNSVS